MEATKAENMISHKDDIFSRPKRAWFMTTKEKKLAAKDSSENGKDSKEEVISAEQAQDPRTKEKRRRERKKNLPQKKLRKLATATEMLEQNEFDESERRKGTKAKKNFDQTASRSEEMRDLFQNDMSERKCRKRSTGPAKKKSSFKSKSRYKKR